MVYYNDNELIIRNMEEADARILTDEEIVQGWHADISKYLTRLKDQSEGKCISLTAIYKGIPAGYVHIYITGSGQCRHFIQTVKHWPPIYIQDDLLVRGPRSQMDFISGFLRYEIKI